MAAMLSDEQCTLLEIVNVVCISGIICAFGISGNIINVIIFYKQGFKNTVNIGFLGLAISDLICLITLCWISVCMNPLIISSGLPWEFNDVMYLTGAWPHVCSSRITSFITVYITAERYLSIALPLKVKSIITRKTATIIMCFIYCINLSSLCPEYATSYLGWGFVSSKNKTLIALMFSNNRKYVEGVVYIINSIFGVLSFVGVIVFTTLLVSKLRQSSQWRKIVTSKCSMSEEISAKDKKIVKMVVFIACILIVCYTPGATIALATFIVGTDFSVSGKYINMCKAMWSIAVVCQSINSSVNFFVYYSMSSKYKETFGEIIWGPSCHRNKHNIKNNHSVLS